MKLNGKILKEGFGNILDSSVVDYSSEFEKNDKSALEKKFIDSIYVFSPLTAGIDFMDNYKDPEHSGSSFIPLLELLPSKPIFIKILNIQAVVLFHY